MKKFYFLISLFSFSTVHASEGYTWLSHLAHSWHVPEHTLSLGLVGIILLVAGLAYHSKVAKVGNAVIPDVGITYRNIVEAYGQFIYAQCNNILGEKLTPRYFSFISTIFLVILISNLLGLVPGFLPPTEYLSTTFAFGVFSFIYYNIQGCKEMGVINYIKHFAGPLWYMAILIFPIEIISNLIRPVSLALRLRGNIFGDHLVVSQFTDLAPCLVPIPFMLLGLLVCFVQAYIFTALSMVYISLATAHQDHDEHD